ncbi:MAG: hypothetical protein NC924_08025, partial [Candidatus Omnitrophica bacterium]|nr:hypothetical protein [Candidatus Omnitrophota bacterium]
SRHLVSGKILNDAKSNLAGVFSQNVLNRIGILDDLHSYYRSLTTKNEGEHKIFIAALNLMNRSFFSSLYGGAYGGWLCRHQNFFGTSLWPFLDKEFLKSMLQVPMEYLTRYSLYWEIMKRLDPKALSLPFCSACDHPQLILEQQGIDPKAIRKSSYAYIFAKLKKVRTATMFDYPEELHEVLSKRATIGLELSPQCFADAELIKVLDFAAWRFRYVDCSAPFPASLNKKFFLFHRLLRRLQ